MELTESVSRSESTKAWPSTRLNQLSYELPRLNVYGLLEGDRRRYPYNPSDAQRR